MYAVIIGPRIAAFFISPVSNATRRGVRHPADPDGDGGDLHVRRCRLAPSLSLTIDVHMHRQDVRQHRWRWAPCHRHKPVTTWFMRCTGLFLLPAHVHVLVH